jgi:Ca-activated chloride channel family protein
MTDERFSLDELANLLGLEKRTIRSWISLDLLPGPDSLGRNAGYGRMHLDRLKAIQRLRREGKLSLTEIRQRFQSLAADEIRALADGRAPVMPSPGGRATRSSSSEATPPSPLNRAGGDSPTARAVRLLESAVGRTVPHKAEHETWNRISVTPDVELAVRDFGDPDQLERLERLADLLREILSGGTTMSAQPPFTLSAGFDKSTVWDHGNSERYLVVALKPLAPAFKRPQVPLNLALVLDVSGSMSGPKLEAVRQASQAIIRSLRDCDTLSVVSFASKVRVLFPGRAMDAAGKAIAQQAVAALESYDSTNLSGGWVQGVNCVAEQASRRPDASNFVVLLTDGQANVGIVDPDQLGLMADSNRRRGINTSAVGVGKDWESRQLETIAGAGGGRLYHAESAEEIATLLRGEFEEIESVIAEDVTLEVEFPREMHVFEHVGVFTHRREGNRLVCSLGSLTSSSAPHVVFRSTTPAGKAKERLVFTVAAQYRTPGDPTPHTTPPVTIELTFATGRDNDATAYDALLAVEAAKAWQAVEVRDALRRNRERRYAKARARLAATIERFAKFVHEKWRLPQAEPLLDEMRELLERIDQDIGEGYRKVVEIKKWKGTRGERDPFGRRTE